MKVYRVRHIPSGLYYCPSREVYVKDKELERPRYMKTNLSKTGKLYSRKPSLKVLLNSCVYVHLRELSTNIWRNQYVMPVKVEDWIIEEVI
jgi:hypothetical protein